MKHNRSVTFAFFFLTVQAFAGLSAGETDPPYLKLMHHPWVDSVFNSLTREEKIGQLVWVKAYPDLDIGQDVWISNVIQKAGIGGVIFSEGFSAEKQTEMINYYQKITSIPLIFAAENEHSPGIGLKEVIRFPYPMTLEAIQNDSLHYRMGKSVAEQLKRAGINISISPYPGIKNDCLNIDIYPVLNRTNPQNACRKKLMYLNGLQGNGVLASSGFPYMIKGYRKEDRSKMGSDNISIKGGTELIEYTDDPDQAIREIADSIKKGLISSESVNERCRLVLAAKYWAGVSRRPFVNIKSMEDDLSGAELKALIRELYANSLTLLRNEDNILPLKKLEEMKMATISVNRTKTTLFQHRLSDYVPADNYSFESPDKSAAVELLKKLQSYNVVIAGLYGMEEEKGPGITSEMAEFLSKLTDNKHVIFVWFGNPMTLEKVDALKKADGLILAYQENEFIEDLSAQLIFGGIGSRGRLPLTINNEWKEGFGITTRGNMRLQYGFPESAGLSSDLLTRKIDSIAEIGLNAKAYPGCEVMIARKGIVVFQKTYGFNTYESRATVREDDIFDLASVTKVSSTLAGLMLLASDGRFSTEKCLGDYLPDFRKTNKGNLLMKDLLTHQAGLKDWIPFWKATVKSDSTFRRNIFSHEFSHKYPVKVADKLYINKNYRRKIFREIKKSPVGEKKYVYSDLTFIISPGIIENLTGEKWYDYVTKNIYHKIGAFDVRFNPYLNYPLSRIIPTEYDSLFRRQLLHGTVHDEGAAMLGGISGHAGLFATANDLMKLMELYRRMGEYGGTQIISRDILEEYTKVQFPENKNRRGLGFDKPFLNNADLSPREAYPAKSASSSSFGHTGYTGTMVWIDPEYEITYIFLSNRVHPTRNNNLLSELNIRSNILQAIYDSITE